MHERHDPGIPDHRVLRNELRSYQILLMHRTENCVKPKNTNQLKYFYETNIRAILQEPKYCFVLRNFCITGIPYLRDDGIPGS